MTRQRTNSRLSEPDEALQRNSEQSGPADAPELGSEQSESADAPASGSDSAAGSAASPRQRKPADALALAYRFVVKRERTVSEVRARLARSECPADEIDGAVAELLEFGYLDDARYASLFIADKRALEGWGRARIVTGLRDRGVDEELIERAFAQSAEVGGPDNPELSEQERAVELLVRRFPSGIDDERDYRRAFAMLVRKGYSSEVSGDAIRAHRHRQSV